MDKEDLYAVMDLNNECTQRDLRLSYKNLVQVFTSYLSSSFFCLNAIRFCIFWNNFVCVYMFFCVCLYVGWCRNGIQTGFMKRLKKTKPR